MKERRLAQTHVVEADRFNARVTAQRTAFNTQTETLRETVKTTVAFILAAIVAFLLLIMVLVAIFGNLSTYLDTTSMLMRLFIQWLVPGCITAVILFCLFRAAESWVRYAREYAEIDEIRARADLTRAEAERIRTRTDLDPQGNQLVLDPISERWVLYTGNMREHPALHSMHYSVKTESYGEEAPALLPGNTAKPKVEDLVKLVERNSFQLPFGNSLRENGPVLVDIDSSHIRVIGSSQKGKSCFAAAVIDLVTQTHDPEVMVIALLDMENKTSKLFEDMEHLAVLNAGRKDIELHARNPRQVAEHLHYIRNEMDRRYSLPEPEQAKQPHILVYIEEFLSLKKHRDLDQRTRSILLDDLNEIAIRGLKAFIHLMACAQVDYADEDLRALNNNFSVNVSFAVRPEAARSAGFVCSDLLSANWASKRKGQCVVEATGCTDLVEAPDYDVKALLKARNETSKVTVTEVSETLPKHERNADRNKLEDALQAKLHQVMESPGETMRDCIRRVWGAVPGDNEGWKLAKGEYEEILKTIHHFARKGMETEEG